MNHEDFERAASYWEQKEKERDASANMPSAELRAAIDDFLSNHNTCALATGTGDFVRCTPLEYLWRDGAFWIFSEGGRKFTGLAHNSNVCLTVFEPYEGFGKLASIQVSGRAEIVDPASPEFVQAMGYRGIPGAQRDKIAHMLHIIKIVPVEVDYLDSTLKKRGYESRQHLSW